MLLALSHHHHHHHRPLIFTFITARISRSRSSVHSTRGRPSRLIASCVPIISDKRARPGLLLLLLCNFLPPSFRSSGAIFFIAADAAGASAALMQSARGRKWTIEGMTRSLGANCNGEARRGSIRADSGGSSCWQLLRMSEVMAFFIRRAAWRGCAERA